MFGGAFDPPHVGHILIVTNILNAGLADEVWIVPSGDGRYDKSPVASARHRSELLRLVRYSVFPDDKRVKIDLTQLNNPADKCYTIDLIDALKSTHAGHDFSLVVGSENAPLISKWRDGERLLKENKFLAIIRPGAETKLNSSENITYLSGPDAVLCNVSSSMVRRFIKENRCLEGLLPAPLIDYIRSEKLYK